MTKFDILAVGVQVVFFRTPTWPGLVEVDAGAVVLLGQRKGQVVGFPALRRERPAKTARRRSVSRLPQRLRIVGGLAPAWQFLL